MTFSSEFKNFHSRKCTCKCHLRNGVHLSWPQCVNYLWVSVCHSSMDLLSNYADYRMTHISFDLFAHLWCEFTKHFRDWTPILKVSISQVERIHELLGPYGTMCHLSPWASLGFDHHNLRVLFQFQDCLLRYWDYHYKDKTVVRASHFIMGIPILTRQHLYIETTPRVSLVV